MDVHRLLRELHEEREEVDEAIARFERLALLRSGKPRRGRPPNWLVEAKKKGGRKRKKKGG